ncbi:MAG: hypothetical protein BWY75_03858 [bacterium ADurb.Bin425]|nr:MAG: hypothetical protein BWY75_03858 [bacterium ADurb.Bin425]
MFGLVICWALIAELGTLLSTAPAPLPGMLLFTAKFEGLAWALATAIWAASCHFCRLWLTAVGAASWKNSFCEVDATA